ncbi:unnamed protein product [Durusdinium trenchii]|uniref:Uncharacterized protein n=2 Tax=Durusdinium trenchii TaxID=1381693 RepID=A0ABP0NT09_9DINO
MLILDIIRKLLGSTNEFHMESFMVQGKATLSFVGTMAACGFGRWMTKYKAWLKKKKQCPRKASCKVEEVTEEPLTPTDQYDSEVWVYRLGEVHRAAFLAMARGYTPVIIVSPPS